MRGEFIRGDGLVIPNNIVLSGKRQLLQRMFWSIDPDEYQALWVGLCDAVFDPNMGLDDIAQTEPPFEGGYQPQTLLRSQSAWTLGTLNGEAYMESTPITWTATGAGFQRSITRLYLAVLDGELIALSGALPAPLRITPSTPATERTFRYRMYMG